MDARLIRNELDGDPRYSGLSPGEIVTAMKAKTRTATHLNLVTIRDVLADWGGNPAGAAAFMDKLQAVAAGNSAVRYGLQLMVTGLAVGHQNTRAMADALVGFAGITAEEVARFKALGEHTVSAWEDCGQPTEQDIVDAVAWNPELSR